MIPVLLDYGHGGFIDGIYQTAGKQYHFTDAPGGPLSIYEGDVNRKVAARLATMLLGAGIEVHDVVAGRPITAIPSVDGSTLEQADISLGRRVAYANEVGRGLFVSIHSNAVGDGIRGPSQPARGFSVWTSPGQTASDAVATVLCAEIAAEFPEHKLRTQAAPDGDPDFESPFYVLAKTRMPAVLSENLFFTNLDDARFLLSLEGQHRIAMAHFRAIRRVIGSKGAA